MNQSESRDWKTHKEGKCYRKCTVLSLSNHDKRMMQKGGIPWHAESVPLPCSLSWSAGLEVTSLSVFALTRLEAWLSCSLKCNWQKGQRQNEWQEAERWIRRREWTTTDRAGDGQVDKLMYVQTLTLGGSFHFFCWISNNKRLACDHGKKS